MKLLASQCTQPPTRYLYNFKYFADALEEFQKTNRDAFAPQLRRSQSHPETVFHKPNSAEKKYCAAHQARRFKTPFTLSTLQKCRPLSFLLPLNPLQTIKKKLTSNKQALELFTIFHNEIFRGNSSRHKAFLASHYCHEMLSEKHATSSPSTVQSGTEFYTLLAKHCFCDMQRVWLLFIDIRELWQKEPPKEIPLNYLYSEIAEKLVAGALKRKAKQFQLYTNVKLGKIIKKSKGSPHTLSVTPLAEVDALLQKKNGQIEAIYEVKSLFIKSLSSPSPLPSFLPSKQQFARSQAENAARLIVGTPRSSHPSNSKFANHQVYTYKNTVDGEKRLNALHLRNIRSPQVFTIGPPEMTPPHKAPCSPGYVPTPDDKISRRHFRLSPRTKNALGYQDNEWLSKDVLDTLDTNTQDRLKEKTDHFDGNIPLHTSKSLRVLAGLTAFFQDEKGWRQKYKTLRLNKQPSQETSK